MPVGLLPEIGAIPLDGIFLGKAVVVKLVFNFQIAVDTVLDLIDGDVAGIGDVVDEVDLSTRPF